MLLKPTRIPKTYISEGETGVINPYASKRTRLAVVLKRTQPHPPLFSMPRGVPHG